MKKIRCVDCDNCINLYIDNQGYLSNDCKNGYDMLFSLEKWDCKNFKATDNKAKIRSIKGSDR